MDAIKITGGRTRRSQGACDALGGPSPAAAGGQGGGGETLHGRRSRISHRSRISRRSRCPCPPVRGTARPGRPPSAALGRRMWRGGAPAPGEGNRGRGKGEGEPPGRAAEHPYPRPLVSPTARSTVRAENRRATSRETRGVRRAGLRFPRAGNRIAVQPCESNPIDLLLHDRAHKVLLKCPSPHARCEIYPRLCLDRFL
ncbi:unnamed protein product [Coccothraustes coccothraustes]